MKRHTLGCAVFISKKPLNVHQCLCPGTCACSAPPREKNRRTKIFSPRFFSRGDRGVRGGSGAQLSFALLSAPCRRFERQTSHQSPQCTETKAPAPCTTPPAHALLAARSRRMHSTPRCGRELTAATRPGVRRAPQMRIQEISAVAHRVRRCDRYPEYSRPRAPWHCDAAC